MTQTFADLVRVGFSVLLAERGFSVVSELAGSVAMESDRLRVQAVLDPRGELGVYAHPKETDARLGWTYMGFVGRASVEGLLEIALEGMLEDRRILEADQAYFDELALQRRADAEAQNRYAAGGSRPPRRGDLP